MKLTGQNAELFYALSKVAAKAFNNTHLLSCSVLSKTPNYGDILERFIKKTPILFPSLLRQVFLFFRYFFVNFGHFCFLLMARFFWSLGNHKNGLSSFSAKTPLVIIDIFALLPKIVTEKKVHDYYLQGLDEQAKNVGFSTLYLYRIYGSRNPKIVYQAMNIMHSSGKGIPEVSLLSFMDWVVLFFHIFAYIPAHRALLSTIKKHIAEAEEGQNTQAEAYILQALYETMGENVMAGELYRLVGRQLTKKLAGRENTIVVSWYENQTVNKAFYSGVNEQRKILSQANTASSTRFIGAQLNVWPEELLNNHADDEEIALGIVPDNVVVNGQYFLPSYSAQQYSVGPALRYKKIFSFTPQPRAQNATREQQESATDDKQHASAHASYEAKSLLVLLSYHFVETKRVLQLVLPLIEKGYSLSYKFHPATNPHDYVALLPKSFVLADKDFYIALQTADAVIGSGSGVMVEAVASGVPALAVEKSGEFCLNFLPDFGQGIVWEKVEKTSDIEPVLAELFKQKKTEAYQRYVSEFKTLFFAEPTQELITQAFTLHIE